MTVRAVCSNSQYSHTEPVSVCVVHHLFHVFLPVVCFNHQCHLRPYLVLLAAAALHRLQYVYRHSAFDEIGSNGVCVCAVLQRTEW